MSDKLARVLTGLAVLAVAMIAAVVSFTHIEALAFEHGQPVGDARLLPLSVDGLLVASSLTLLVGARTQRPASGLARFGLVLGVIATVLANVTFGVHAGPVGAVISAWPAVSFIVSTEILVGQMRRARTTPAPATAVQTVADDVPVNVPKYVPVIEPVAVTASTVPPAPVATARTVASGRARGRASKAPEKVFAPEISRGEMPSLRVIKVRAKCGTDRARVIRDQLAEILQEVPAAA